MPAHYEYSFFLHTRDNRPKSRRHSLLQLKRVFGTPQIVADKSLASLFCPAKFATETKRATTNVESVSMLVFDMDCGLSWDSFVTDWRSQGLAFFIYTTYKHKVQNPRWRAVFLLENPVSRDDWAKTWTYFSNELTQGHTDAACKDAGRMYYLPCCSEEGQAVFQSFFYDGKLLDAGTVPDEAAKPEQPPSQAEPGGRERVGDWFNANVSIEEVLVPQGWRKTSEQGGLQYWARPGKDGEDVISASYGFRQNVNGERFFCFSSAVNDVPVRKMLTKFALYAYLEHAGDFRLAGRRIAEKYALDRPKQTAVKVGTDHDDWIRQACTDAANGERLVERYGNQFRYVAELRDWARWDGARWLIAPKAEADLRVMAVESARQTQQAARKLDNPNHLQKLLTWAIRSQDSSRISNAIREAQAMLTISVNDFDRQPWILNCLNGMVDLRNGKLLPHDRNLLVSQVTACEIAPDDEDAAPKVFTQFVNRILPDDETLAFLLQFLGYSLTGSLMDQSYAFFHGATGNNGKSTLVDLLLWLLGDYAVTLDTESLMLTRGFASNVEYEFARLRGKRFAVAHEVSDNQRINEPLIKRLTGGDTIRARQPYGLPFEFRPSAKICMTGNNKPTITSQDSATWRRVNLVPFEVEVPAEERDPMLGEKLRAEGPQILRYLVQWCLNFQRRGLVRSPAMVDSRTQYREENDFLAEFISSECVFGDAYTVGCSELHQRYIEWARRTMSVPLTPTSFGRIMSQRAAALNIVRVRNGAGRKIWKGCDVVEK